MNGFSTTGWRERSAVRWGRNRFVAPGAGCLFLFFLLVMWATPADAQVLSVDPQGTASGTANSDVDLSITLSPASASIASLQFDVVFSSPLSFVSATAGSAASAAQKSVVSNPVPGGIRILVYNLDRNVIGSGAVVIFRFHIASGTSPGDYPVTLENLFASDTIGGAAPISGTNGGVSCIPDPGSLIISNIASSSITSSSVIITWSTNKPADSRLEYGTTSGYGSSTVLDTSMVTAHSGSLTGLSPGTLYHYRVISRDGSGGVMQSGDFTVTTLNLPGNFIVATTLYYPRLFTGNSFSIDSPDEEFVGVAVANRSGGAAILRFTAYNPDGTQITGSGINNPIIIDNFGADRQMALIDMELFGNGIRGPDKTGWVKIESSASGMAGLFMNYDAALRELDGSGITSVPTNTIVYPAIESPGFTRVNIANPNAVPVTLNFSLVGSDGTVLKTAQRTVPPDGALIGELATDVFPGTFLAPSAYVRVTADYPVLAYEMFGKSLQYVQGLAGQDVTRGATTLYCPQYAVGTEWGTALSIINLDGVAGNVTLTMYSNDGNQIGTPQTVAVGAHGKIYLDDPAFFQSPPAQPGYYVNDGYVEIKSNGIQITGSVVFGDPGRAVFSSALPLMNSLQTSTVFGHVASDHQYFTGLAIFNPSDSTDAHVTVNLYRSDGTLEDTTGTITITPRKRISQVLTQWFPSLEGLEHPSGYFTVTSDIGVAAFALFGTHDLSVLSAIPHGEVR